MNWVWELLKVKEAWKTLDFDRITKVRIALLDTGCDVEHSFFRDSRIECIDINDKPVTGDGLGYGTYFCGLLMQYLNIEDRRKPEIISIKLGTRLRVAIDDICKGIDTAIRKGADIINLGSSNLNYNAKLASKINEAVEMGIIVVSHSGNVIVREHTFPASLDNVISVAAIDENCRLTAHSNFNNLVNICAPGTGMMGPFTKEQAKNFDVKVDDNGMASTYGTSFAAAAVVAVAAMVKAIMREINTYQFMNLLESSPSKQCVESCDGTTPAKHIINFRSILSSLLNSDILEVMNKPIEKYYYWNIKYADGFEVGNEWEADLYDSSGKAVVDKNGKVEIELYKLNRLKKEAILSETFVYEKGKLIWKLNYDVPGNYFIKIKVEDDSIISVDSAAKVKIITNEKSAYLTNASATLGKTEKKNRRESKIYPFMNLLVTIGSSIVNDLIKK